MDDRGIVVLAQNTYNNEPKYERQFNSISHVDVWYDSLEHVKGQHVWYNNTIYTIMENQPANTKFNERNTNVVAREVLLIDDENKNLKFDNPTTGKLSLVNNKIMLCQYAGKDNYVLQACLLAMSVKATNPNEKISLVTDDHVPDEYINLFDKIISIPWEDDARLSEWKIENRWKLYHCTPYKKTLVLDTDVLVLQDINHWWDFFARYKLYFTSTVYTYRDEVADNSYYRYAFIENNLPNVYSGMHYFEKSDEAQEFYKWLELVVQNWKSFYEIFLRPDTRPPRPSIDLCAAIVTKLLDCEESVMNKKEKVTHFTHLKAHSQGWKKSPKSWQQVVGTYINPQCEIKIGNYLQSGILHYTENDFLNKTPAIERYKALVNV